MPSLNRAVLLGVLLCGASCAAGGVHRTKPSAPTAVANPDCVVLVAATEPAGLAAERAWLHQSFPGWKAKSQSVGRDGTRIVDLLVVLDAAGAEHSVCFDITGWFGKF